MLNAYNRHKAVGSTKPTGATPGVNKESRKPTLCRAYWGGSKTLKPLIEAVSSTIAIAKSEIIYQQLRVQKWGSSQSQNRQPAEKKKKKWSWLQNRGSSEPRPGRPVLTLMVWNCGETYDWIPALSLSCCDIVWFPEPLWSLDFFCVWNKLPRLQELGKLNVK